jgi:hypothetical protein
MKLGVTWNDVTKMYYNITEKQVKTFVKLCPVCNKQNPWILPSKGAQKPIRSGQFRDCYQVDFIEYCRKKPAKDVYGQTMRWLLVLKDHFSGLSTKFCCI